MAFISGKQLFNWQQQAQAQAKQAQIDLYELELLLTELTVLDSLALKLKSYQNQASISSQVSLEKLEQLWQLRIEKRCPIQYLLGNCHWRNFNLKVTPDVLIPRPETELIIDLAKEIVSAYPHLASGKWLDLGTGSGAIAIGLADSFAQAQIYAVDKSKAALAIAQENALKYNYDKRITLCHGSWFEPVSEQKKSFSVIVSNPPYIPSQIVGQLQPEVVNHEPVMALDGGKDGLDDIRYLVQTAPEYLVSKGFLLLEMMAGQGEEIQQIIKQNGAYQKIKIHHDLANLDRFAIAQIK